MNKHDVKLICCLKSVKRSAAPDLRLLDLRHDNSSRQTTTFSSLFIVGVVQTEFKDENRQLTGEQPAFQELNDDSEDLPSTETEPCV